MLALILVCQLILTALSKEISRIKPDLVDIHNAYVVGKQIDIYHLPNHICVLCQCLTVLPYLAKEGKY